MPKRDSERIKLLYEESKNIAIDIVEHLDFLRDFCLENDVRTVVEYGTRDGFSTTAFLQGGAKVTCVDVCKTSRADYIQQAAGDDMDFVISNTAEYDLPAGVELLFIDTLHTYKHVVDELKTIKHAYPKYIMFHDTVLNGSWDEDNQGGPGIMSAVLEFLTANPYRVIVHRSNNCGLTVLALE